MLAATRCRGTPITCGAYYFFGSNIDNSLNGVWSPGFCLSCNGCCYRYLKRDENVWGIFENKSSCFRDQILTSMWLELTLISSFIWTQPTASFEYRDLDDLFKNINNKINFSKVIKLKWSLLTGEFCSVDILKQKRRHCLTSSKSPSLHLLVVDFDYPPSQTRVVDGLLGVGFLDYYSLDLRTPFFERFLIRNSFNTVLYAVKETKPWVLMNRSISRLQQRNEVIPLRYCFPRFTPNIAQWDTPTIAQWDTPTRWSGREPNE